MGTQVERRTHAKTPGECGDGGMDGNWAESVRGYKALRVIYEGWKLRQAAPPRLRLLVSPSDSTCRSRAL